MEMIVYIPQQYMSLLFVYVCVYSLTDNTHYAVEEGSQVDQRGPKIQNLVTLTM